MDFEETLAKKREEARKSDLENLSQAFISVEESERNVTAWAEKKMAEFAKLKAEIKELASVESPDHEKVRDVYARSQDKKPGRQY